jgi:hypothetical protein
MSTSNYSCKYMFLFSAYFVFLVTSSLANWNVLYLALRIIINVWNYLHLFPELSEESPNKNDLFFALT